MPELVRTLERLLRPLRRQIAMMIGRGVVQRVDDSKGVQLVQPGLLAGETREALEHVQPYGLSSVPLEGAEPVVALFVHGNRDHGLIVQIGDRRYRLKGLASGEVALYDDLGKRIVLKRDGTIELVADKLDVTTSGDVNLTAGGNVNLGGPGGAAVARVGDLVDVTSGSSTGQWPIISGSSKVKAT